jgi:hypothetical protein
MFGNEHTLMDKSNTVTVIKNTSLGLTPQHHEIQESTAVRVTRSRRAAMV